VKEAYRVIAAGMWYERPMGKIPSAVREAKATATSAAPAVS
jgi:hypothetical protein